MARLSCGLSAILVFVLSRNLRPMRLSRRPQAFDGSGAIRRRYEQRVDDASLVSDYKASSAQTAGAVAKLMGSFPI